MHKNRSAFVFLSLVLSLHFAISVLSPKLGHSEKPEILEMKEHTKNFNRLGQEKSPYLLQHRENPVNWYPWGEDAFRAAREQNKPIFLSIGYSTCYWCHVMEKDSFEQEDVAEVVNKHYIAIKVDREELPDVDKTYMSAVIALTGHGGWPMSVFLTPELKPFYGGTFFWRTQFIQLLERIRELWTKQNNNVRYSADQITAALKQQNDISQSSIIGEETFDEALEQYSRSFDPYYGGFGREPKFPPSDDISLLLRIFTRKNKEKALAMATKTLDAMAKGGLYDHLGGGFHRYSTDSKWLVPHFEKMLYDNALLSWTYLEAYQLTQNKMYAAVARETLDYVLAEMTSENGGFYSAEDAGEVDKEGEFYVWTEDELSSLLSEAEFNSIKNLYGVSSAGSFENNTNILNLQDNISWESKYDSTALSAREKLLQVRNEREHPHKDDKILTAWNGLMISAMAKGFQVLQDKRYLEAAQNSAAFIKSAMFKNDTLLRRYRDDEARFDGTLDDYSFLIQGLLNLYESDFDLKWIRWGEELQKIQDNLFWDEQNKGYFFSVDKETSIIRQKDFADGATPSGNSIALHNLLRFFDFTFEKSYQDRALQLFDAASSSIAKYPSGIASGMIALDYHLDQSKEIAILTSSDTKTAAEMKKFLYSNFLPNKSFAFGSPANVDDPSALAIFRGRQLIDGKTTFYVCKNQVCKLPTTAVEKAKKLVLR